MNSFTYPFIHSFIYVLAIYSARQAMSDVLDVQGELNRHSPDFMRTSLTEVL